MAGNRQLLSVVFGAILLAALLVGPANAIGFPVEEHPVGIDPLGDPPGPCTVHPYGSGVLPYVHQGPVEVQRTITYGGVGACAGLSLGFCLSQLWWFNPGTFEWELRRSNSETPFLGTGCAPLDVVFGPDLSLGLYDATMIACCPIAGGNYPFPVL